jgi:phosphoglycerate dehydrogenase-like enzyme
MPTTLLMMPPQNEKTREWGQRVAEACPEIEVIVPETMEGAEQAIGMADAAFGAIPPALLPRAEKLRWLQSPQIAPPAGYYYPELIEHPVVVTNFREIFNDHIGAHVMAFVLHFARGLHVYLPQQLQRQWKKMPRDTGTICPRRRRWWSGSAASARGGGAARQHLRHARHRRRRAPSHTAAGVTEAARAAALDELLPQADFVILTVPHTPDTEFFMNRARFQRMKRGAFFINIGRGRTTRLDDLVAALKAGEIAGAALDVFEQAPLPAEHPLWTMPGVLITPHTAGYGPYLDERRYEVLADNCQRFLAGQELRNIVDKSRWF